MCARTSESTLKSSSLRSGTKSASVMEATSAERDIGITGNPRCDILTQTRQAANLIEVPVLPELIMDTG